MKKTKLFTSIAALALVLGLGACEVNVGDVNIGGDSSETTETESSQTEDTTEGGGTSEEGIVFGFELDGELNAIDGGYILKDDGSPYLYELTYTSNLSDALKFTYEAGEAVGEYYISTEIEGVQTWVAIVTTEDNHTNVNYVTDKTPLYWNPTYECWGNEEQTHFLCCNTTFGCLYCSLISEYGPSGSKGTSPIAGLYNTDGSKVTGFVGEPVKQEELPSSEVTYVGDVVEGTYKFGAFDTTSWSYLYISTGVSTASNHYLIPTSDWTYGANISITSYEDGYTLSYELGEQTRYITYTGRSTAVTTSTQPYVWYYDSENTVFTSVAENGRFLGLAENADAFRAYSYTNDGLTKYAHAIPYTTEPGPEENPNEGDNEGGEGETTTYKLGVLNESLYTYYYFDGTIDSGRFANGTATYDDAVALTLDEAEEGITLSWEADGKTYYLGYGLNGSSQTCVVISEEVTYLKLNTTYNSIEDPEGKYFLGTYSNFTTMSWCGISYYGEDYIAHLYTEAQTNPEAPETSRTESDFEKVSSLESGKEYYIGGTYNSSLYLATGKMGNNYRLAGSSNLDDAAAFTITGNNIDGYKLTLADGTYLYAFYKSNYHDFGLSDAATVPDNGTNLFFWDNTSATLYIQGSSIGSSYNYVYFEMYNGNITLWGASNTSSFSSAASFYQLVVA